MKPIYKPAGRALEYSPDALALNIYTGCPHRCYYCFVQSVLHTDREKFHSNVTPREGLLTALSKQLDAGVVEYYETVQNGPTKSKVRRDIPLYGKMIHLCFSCDPYPVGHDTSITRDVIKNIKAAGCHVQILTKGGAAAERDFDLLDENDWFGVTATRKTRRLISAERVPKEPNAAPTVERLALLEKARDCGINTWISLEPVLSTDFVYEVIKNANYIDLYRIGKLNYHPSDIDWAAFGRECVRLCEEHSRAYCIKADLRAAMEKGGAV